jgi:diguanylate cyclase (GGDEF)-like protein
MHGLRPLTRFNSTPLFLVSLAIVIALGSVAVAVLPVPGTRLPALNVMPAFCLAVSIAYGYRVWPAVLMGSAAWSTLAFFPDWMLVAGYSIGITASTLLATWGIGRFWEPEISRNAVHNLLVVYLFGALVYGLVMVAVAVPAAALILGLDITDFMLASVWMTTYMASGIGVFLPAIMLAVIRVPRIHQTGDSAQTPLTFVRLSRGGWIAMTVPLAVGHFLLLAAGEVALAATLRYAMLFMLIIAALRFQYKFYIQLLVGVVIYLLVAEAVLDGGVNMNPELPSLLRNTVILAVSVLSSQLIATYRMQGAAAVADLKSQALHDSATGVLNRRAFRQRLESAVKARGRADNACFYIDVDQFAVVSDNFGFDAGTLLLKDIAEVIGGGLPVTATLARLEGDDFAVLLEHCSTEDAMSVASDTCQRIAGHGFTWNGNPQNITISIGLVPFRSGEGDADTVMLTAHTAMQLANKGGGGGVQILDLDDNAVAERKRTSMLVEEIRDAIRHNRFDINCQELRPIQTPAEGKLSYEILSRMTGRDGKPLPPVEIFPLAEKFELMRAIDRLVTESTISWLTSHPECMERTGVCCINLSGASLDAENVSFFSNLLDDYGVPPGKLCFEVTETAVVTHFNAAVEFMQQLKEKGCSFALDDFGTGMSSFEYFSKLPVDKIKIDGSFIRGLTKESRNYAIVRAVVSIAEAFSLQTVAEFVETEEILELLTGLGVTFAQGHIVREAQPIAAFFKGGKND